MRVFSKNADPGPTELERDAYGHDRENNAERSERHERCFAAASLLGSH
jgi:hypothetical protein